MTPRQPVAEVGGRQAPAGMNEVKNRSPWYPEGCCGLFYVQVVRYARIFLNVPVLFIFRVILIPYFNFLYLKQ